MGIIGGRPKHSVYFVGFQGVYHTHLHIEEFIVHVVHRLLYHLHDCCSVNSLLFVCLTVVRLPDCCLFVVSDDKLLHLDPHYCQNYVDTTLDDYDLKVSKPVYSLPQQYPPPPPPPSSPPPSPLPQSYHCSTPRKLPASKMDPSCTIGFFCTSQEDFQKLREQAEKVTTISVHSYNVQSCTLMVMRVQCLHTQTHFFMCDDLYRN